MKTEQAEKSTSPEIEELADLIQLARKDTKMAWDEIDGRLPGYISEPEFVSWAQMNENSADRCMQKLAMMILEKSDRLKS